MKNLEWKQIDWFEADGKIVFDDHLGFVRAKTQNTTFKVVSTDFPGISIGLEDCFYINEAMEKVSLDKDNIADLFSQDIFVANPPKKMSVQSLIVRKWYTTKFTDDRSGIYARSFDVEINRVNLSTNPLAAWYCEKMQNMQWDEIYKFYQRPLFSDLQVGQSVFHKNLGKCEIAKIYEQPDMEDRMIDIQAKKQKIRTIKFGSPDSDSVYKIPYQSSTANALEQFNTCKNEFQLSPYALIDKNRINIYWQQIPNAASYTISLYKLDNRPYMQQIYHLKDYIVERGTGFLPIKDLLGNDYIAVVKAEDRPSEIIAQSRGIAVSGNKSHPRFWE